MSKNQASRDTHEIVVNWDDGVDVRVELVLAVKLSRPTRTYSCPDLPRILDAMSR